LLRLGISFGLVRWSTVATCPRVVTHSDVGFQRSNSSSRDDHPYCCFNLMLIPWQSDVGSLYKDMSISGHMIPASQIHYPLSTIHNMHPSQCSPDVVLVLITLFLSLSHSVFIDKVMSLLFCHSGVLGSTRYGHLQLRSSPIFRLVICCSGFLFSLAGYRSFLSSDQPSCNLSFHGRDTFPRNIGDSDFIVGFAQLNVRIDFCI